ncbi:hypothetical protein GCM10009630_34530 [Kribbella jejuensis]|uniref:Uncharacterized protein n=1 Tax=Kribbella jejuensis TaxID=236068 RepID=A0A542DSX6_9ACTN|nr:hypothetical protein [Kribbella jejuensis]TQJ06209.1 hypothetical protein FB475_5864 [Kribbella jejuensis]
MSRSINLVMSAVSVPSTSANARGLRTAWRLETTPHPAVADGALFTSTYLLRMRDNEPVG